MILYPNPRIQKSCYPAVMTTFACSTAALMLIIVGVSSHFRAQVRIQKEETRTVEAECDDCNKTLDGVRGLLAECRTDEERIAGLLRESREQRDAFLMERDRARTQRDDFKRRLDTALADVAQAETDCAVLRENAAFDRTEIESQCKIIEGLRHDLAKAKSECRQCHPGVEHGK